MDNKVWTLKSVSKMGDPHPTYGTAYWCYAYETEMPLKFNSKEEHIPVESKITAEEQEVKPGKNGQFLALKKVKIQRPEGAQQTMPTQQSTGSLEQKVDEILAIVKELRGDEPVVPNASLTSPDNDPEDDEEPVDLSDIPFN